MRLTKLYLNGQNDKPIEDRDVASAWPMKNATDDSRASQIQKKQNKIEKLTQNHFSRSSRERKMAKMAEDETQLMLKIAKILDEARASNAIHARKLKELSALRSKTTPLPSLFLSAFSKTLLPLFHFKRRVASAERIVRFVSVFAASGCHVFLEDFLRFLLAATTAANKTARFRACQIISEVRLRNLVSNFPFLSFRVGLNALVLITT